MSKIRVTGCDNQIIIIATTGATTYEICNITGHGGQVDVTLNLVQGDYTEPFTGYNVGTQTATVRIPVATAKIGIVGFNWGGPGSFNVSVNDQNYTKSGNGEYIVPLGPEMPDGGGKISLIEVNVPIA